MTQEQNTWSLRLPIPSNLPISQSVTYQSQGGDVNGDTFNVRTPFSTSTHHSVLSHQTASLRTSEVPCCDFHTVRSLNMIGSYLFVVVVAMAAPKLL